MKRMTEEKAEQMLAFFANDVDFDNIPLDDAKTYELFQRADTDGIFIPQFGIIIVHQKLNRMLKIDVYVIYTYTTTYIAASCLSFAVLLNKSFRF